MTEPNRPNTSCSETDHQALVTIQEIMSGARWSPDTLDAIAETMRDAGYEIKDSGDELPEPGVD